MVIKETIASNNNKRFCSLESGSGLKGILDFFSVNNGCQDRVLKVHN